MVQLQDFISKRLHHHTFSNMFSYGISKAHHARILSCSGPKVGTWLTIRLIFPAFQLFSPIFCTTLCTQFALPHPSIASIPRCVCTHPIDSMVSTSYIVFMAMNTLEPMMQSVTPLPPLCEMLVSTWDENNYMRFLNHIQLLSLTSWHCVYQRWHLHFNPHCHCQPNVSGFTSPSLRNSSICFLRCNSSQGKELSQPTPHWSIPPLAIEVFGCLHKHVDVFLYNCANAIWSLKGTKGPRLSTLVTFFHKKVLITLQKMQTSSILS
jgi:hypothetical protein